MARQTLEMKQIDLRKEQREILTHIKQRVKDFAVYEHTGPGDGYDDIGFIELGFQFDQAGWLALVFDTRPDASGDGSWTLWIEENQFDRGHWFQLFDDLVESANPIQIIDLEGKKRIFKSYDEGEIAVLIGDLLKETLLLARKEKVFLELPLAKNCLMGVEEQSGLYGWPEWEKRAKEGCVD